MHKSKLALIAFVVGCHDNPGPTSARGTAPSPTTRAVDAVVGVWKGMAVDTPFGDFPIALVFERTPDGGVHTRLDDGKGMYLDFQFQPSGELIEEGQIPSMGKQTHKLAPVAGEARWADHDVSVVLDITGDAMVMSSAVHGKAHAMFRMQRAAGPEGDQIREKVHRMQGHVAGVE